MSFLLGLCCAIVGIIPLLIGTEFATAVIMGVIYTLFGSIIIYCSAPSLVYPLFGLYGVLATVFSSLSVVILLCIADNRREYKNPWGALLPVSAIAIYIFVGSYNSAMFNSENYAKLIGPVEERVWTQDIQPKDPKHMLMGSSENALYQADKALGQDGAIGSQFQVDKGAVTLQKIKDQWFYVVPLEYRKFFVYLFGADGIPAYVQVSAQNPSGKPELVILKDKMKYAPSAYFNYNLERHLRYHGYLKADMFEYLYEVDDDGAPWWVVPIFVPQFGWWGEKIIEIAKVNPATGEIIKVDLNAIPAWMDRVFPRSLVQNYLTWKGKYKKGWWNSWLSSLDVTIAGRPILIYGADGEPYWVSGITSDNSSDSSLQALAYSDARLGKTVIYKVKGGLTDEAVLRAIEKNSEVHYKNLRGVNVQIYNCYGTMAAVVPLLNEGLIFQGVAIVNIDSQGDQIAVGVNQEQALRKYQSMLEQNGQQVAISKEHAPQTINGTITRIGFDYASSTYCLLMADQMYHVFAVSPTGHPELPLTQPGDKVELTYKDSGEKVLPVIDFTSQAITLTGTADENAVKEQADADRAQKDVREAAPTVQADVKSRLDKMTPEQLQALQKTLDKK